MRILTTLAATLFLATPTLAHDGAKDPDVMARMQGMKSIAGAMKTLGGMAKGQTPLHQAKARMARDTIVTHSGKITTLFESPATDPKSEAKPEIWDNWADFSAKADTLTVAAKAMDFKDTAALQDSMRAVGSTCGSCHKTYRIEK